MGGAAAGVAGVSALYLLSVGVVDVFAGQVGGPPPVSDDRLDVLAKEAQTALSVVWTVVGFGIGGRLLLRRSELRLAGLAVLALATVKVFIVDLSSLDVAYRVVVLIVLGLLLVVSAYAWTRRVKPAETGERPAKSGGAEADGPSSASAGRPDAGSLVPPALRRHVPRHHAAGGRPR